MAVFVLVPVVVETPGDVGDDTDLLFWIEIDAAQHHPQFTPDGAFVGGVIHAEHFDLAGIRMHHAENGFQRGGLACAIAPDKAHHRTFRHGKGHTV